MLRQGRRAEQCGKKLFERRDCSMGICIRPIRIMGLPNDSPVPTSANFVQTITICSCDLSKEQFQHSLLTNFLLVAYSREQRFVSLQESIAAKGLGDNAPKPFAATFSTA